MSEENISEYSTEVQELIKSVQKQMSIYQTRSENLNLKLKLVADWLQKVIAEYEIQEDYISELADIMEDYISLTKTFKVTVQAEWDVWVDLPYNTNAEDIDNGEFNVDISSYYYDLSNIEEKFIEVTDVEEQ